MAKSHRPSDVPEPTRKLVMSLRFDSEALLRAVDAYRNAHRQSRNSAILTLIERALRDSGDYLPDSGQEGS